MDDKTGVILVGHGAAPLDCPRQLLTELKRLQAERLGRGGPDSPMSPREAELYRRIRSWPRSAQNDPYWAGLNEVASKLQLFLGSAKLRVAFNELCAPNLQEAAEELVGSGCRKIVVCTVMTTRGGSHSEFEIPQIVEKLKARFPEVEIVYAWPFDPVQVAELYARHLHKF